MDSTTMNSTAMNSIGQTEFSPFSRLPFELRQLIWNEALPSLEIQRFNAEIALHPDSPPAPSDDPSNLILCLTPHEDFVRLTKGYLGLLGACYESRMTAISRIPDKLPINYIALDGGGRPVVRFARVPFNLDGQVYISGLRTALFQTSPGRGARGIRLPAYYSPPDVAKEIQCVTIPDIKNLTITLDEPRRIGVGYTSLRWLGRNSNQTCFSNFARRMEKLQVVGLVDEAVLNAWHWMCPEEFNSLHKRAPAVRPRNDDDNSTVEISWLKLYTKLRRSINEFIAKTLHEIQTQHD